jgi:hypothetical protein
MNIFLIMGTISLSCTNNKKIDLKNDLTDSTFNSFLLKFDTLDLPFAVQNLDEFFKFNDSITVEDSLWVKYTPNPNFKTIDSIHFKSFLGKKYSSLNSHYLYLFKYDYYDFYLIIIKQSIYDKHESWLKLNLYNKLGTLLDTITIAGQKVYFFDKYCSIDTNNIISILTLFDNNTKWDSTTDTYFKQKVRESYKVSSDGHFERIGYKKYYGRIKVVNNTIIDIEE